MERPGYVHILEKLDHATFDAALIQTWRPDYHWIRPHFNGPGFVLQDFCNYTQKHITAVLSSTKEMQGQKLTDDRTVLQYVAFEMLQASAYRVHLRQMDVQSVYAYLRDDFQRCLNTDTLTTINERSPLWGKGVRRPYENTKVAYDQPLQSQYDRALLSHLIGKNPNDLPAFMESAVGNLTSLDRGQIDIFAEDFRRDMRALLEDQPAFYPELQEKMRALTFAAWLKNRDADLEKHLADVQAALAAEMPDEEVPDLLAAELEALPLLCDSLEKLLKQDTSKPDVKEAIMRRLPGLEYLGLLAAQEGDLQNLWKIRGVMHSIATTLHLRWGEHPLLTYVGFAIASHATHMTQDRILRPVDLQGEL